jgi:hypothetical protein
MRNSEWLYSKVQRVPKITDEQIREMIHIEPLLKTESNMYQRIAGIPFLDPRKDSFLWDAKPIGREFTFTCLNITEIITQHKSGVFFKPSLAEVYAWIRVYMPETWKDVDYFCMGEPKRIGGSSDIMCQCEIMVGKTLVKGKSFVYPGGQIGYELVEEA